MGSKCRVSWCVPDKDVWTASIIIDFMTVFPCMIEFIVVVTGCLLQVIINCHLACVQSMSR